MKNIKHEYCGLQLSINYYISDTGIDIEDILIYPEDIDITELMFKSNLLKDIYEIIREND